MNTLSYNFVRVLGAALVAFAFMFSASSALASDLPEDGGYSYDYSYPLEDSGGYSYDYSYPFDSGYSYDYSYPLYDSYSSPSYSSYSYPSYSSPSYPSYSYPSYSMPKYPSAPGNSTAISTTNIKQDTFVDDHSVWQYVDNTCSSPGSCSIDDHSIFNAPTTVTIANSNPQPAVVYQQPPVYYQQPPVYHPKPSYQQPAPYVSLAAVPYTGLELGPVGTALYWGFLVLWCLIAAYLIAVKRVQNTLVSSLNAFLFGQRTPATAGGPALSPSAPAAYAKREHARHPAGETDSIDPFIASQIYKHR